MEAIGAFLSSRGVTRAGAGFLDQSGLPNFAGPVGFLPASPVDTAELRGRYPVGPRAGLGRQSSPVGIGGLRTRPRIVH